MKKIYLFSFISIALMLMLNIKNVNAQNCDSLKVPYRMGFEPSDISEFNNWNQYSTIGQDWKVWNFQPHTGAYSLKLHQFNHTWLFSRCFQLSSSKEYLLTLWQKNYSNTYLNQNLLITIGYSDTTTTIIDTIADLKKLNNTNYKKRMIKFIVPKDSTYHIGFFAYGIDFFDESGIYLDDLEISEYNCENIHPNLGNDTLICKRTSITLDAGEGVCSSKCVKLIY